MVLASILAVAAFALGTLFGLALGRRANADAPHMFSVGPTPPLALVRYPDAPDTPHDPAAERELMEAARAAFPSLVWPDDNYLTR